MLSVIQLVTHAEVSVDSVVIGSIQKGIMALVGIEKTDTEKEAEKLFNVLHQQGLIWETVLSVAGAMSCGS